MTLYQHTTATRPAGFSLLEVLIATSLLIVSLFGIVQITRQGGVTTEAFSSEHFSAMFLAQKVLEDIHHQLEHNPHYFTDLTAIAGGETKEVVDGRHSLFRLLENTRNFTSLDPNEDGPIEATSGRIYHQLKGFRITMETRFVPDPVTGDSLPNLIDLHLKIQWQSATGQARSYALHHFLTGLGKAQFGALAPAQAAPAPDGIIGRTLWEVGQEEGAPNPPALSSFLAQNGGNQQLVKALGQMLAAAGRIVRETDALNQQIVDLRATRDAAMGSTDPQARIDALRAQIRIADLFEQKAVTTFLAIARAYPSLVLLSGQQITADSVGTLLKDEGGQLIHGCLVLMTAIGRIRLNLDSAEAEFGKLLRAPFVDTMAARRQTFVVRRMLDQMKLRALVAEDGPPAQKALTDLHKALAAQQKAYAGKIPAFISFLDREAAIAATLASLQTFYGNTKGVAGHAANLKRSQSLLTALAKKVFDGIGVAKPVEMPDPEPEGEPEPELQPEPVSTPTE